MKKLSLLILALAVLGSAHAAIRLPHVLSDGMVLQQQSSARLWGWATPGSTVSVSASWNAGKIVTAKAEKDGRWEARVATPAASFTKQTITFAENKEGKGTKVRLRDVLIGEVWVCAGQSNMEFPVRGFGNCPMKDYNNVVAEASRYNDIEGFEVAGADKVFHKATAGHFWVPGNDPRNETIYVVSPEVKSPVAVRYCFRNFQIGNLGGNNGLPLFPFRTDKW